ncbi:MAG: tetratricopeptide repeat protein [Chromatiales bacterium]|nr:tetratricopeptide repeat protein [Chromatiales bacterium]
MLCLGKQAENNAQLAKQQLAAVLQLEHPDILTIQGNAQQIFGHFDEAENYYRRAITIDETNSSIYSKLLFTLNYHPNRSPDEIFSASTRFQSAFWSTATLELASSH